MQLSSESFELPLQWRLSAELLAYTVWRLFPHVQLIGGGNNSLGFYYDFIFPQPLTKETVELIEVELHRFIKEDHPIRYLSMMRENAQSLFKHHRQDIFAEKAGEEECNILELLQLENFYSLCPNLALTSTLEAGHIKLLDCLELPQEAEQTDAGKITRLIGTSRPHAKELKAFIKTYDSFLKKRDHRILGPRLNLFSFSEKMGSFGVIWHPKGMQLFRLLQNLVEKGNASAVISTPIAIKEDFLTPDLEEVESFFFDGKEYFLRSSFLLQHLESLKYFSLDFEELPWRVSEVGNIFRSYPESQRWGLFTASTNLCHQTTICCKKEQVVPELISSLQLIEQIITMFDFKARWVLIVGRLKNHQNQQQQEAIGWLRKAFEESGCNLPLAPDFYEDEGETSRLELRVSDAIGREWAVSAIGIMTAVSENGKRPEISANDVQSSLVVLSRQIIGSFDRFVGLLLEHSGGIIPFWLMPEQVRVIAIGDANRDYARELSRKLEQNGLRVRLDLREGKLGARIHEAETENIPYLLLVGEQERVKQKISVREAGKPHHNQLVDLETFFTTIFNGRK